MIWFSIFFSSVQSTWPSPYEVPNTVLYILWGNRKQIIVSSCYLADVLVHLDWIPRLDYWSGRAWQGDRELTVSKTPGISGPASCPFPDLDCLPEPASRLLILPGWFVLDIALICLVPLNSMEHWECAEYSTCAGRHKRRRSWDECVLEELTFYSGSKTATLF